MNKPATTPAPSPTPSRALETTTDPPAWTGVAYGLFAYTWWGLVPIYFKAVSAVTPLEVLAHRVVWGVILLGLLMKALGRFPIARDALRDPRVRITLLGSTTLIAVNWFVFIWAVTNNLVLHASLGYYINPLVSVLLGRLFLGERLRRLQRLSVVIAAAGVTYLTLFYGVIPWVAFVLAFSFGLYGLLRKTARVDSLVGLTLEIALLSPWLGGYVAYLIATGDSYITTSTYYAILLPLGSVITAAPLLAFTAAARRLKLATVGFLQYIAPTMQFILAVALFGEVFTRDHLISFCLIWTALAIYSADTAWASRTHARRYHTAPTPAE